MTKADKQNLARCAREVREIADLLLSKLEFMEKELAGPAERPRHSGRVLRAAERRAS